MSIFDIFKRKKNDSKDFNGQTSNSSSESIQHKEPNQHSILSEGDNSASNNNIPSTSLDGLKEHVYSFKFKPTPTNPSIVRYHNSFNLSSFSPNEFIEELNLIATPYIEKRGHVLFEDWFVAEKIDDTLTISIISGDPDFSREDDPSYFYWRTLQFVNLNGLDDIAVKLFPSLESANEEETDLNIYLQNASKASDLKSFFDIIIDRYMKKNRAVHIEDFIVIEKDGKDFSFYITQHPEAEDRDYVSPLHYTELMMHFYIDSVRQKIAEHFFPQINSELQTADPINESEPFSIDSKYDEKQVKVIELDRGYHLVLASAGCGKTDILAERVHRAIALGVNVDDMLCLTFTNRASRGMRNRIKKIVGDKANELFIGNTHRFCSKFVFDNNIINQSSAIMDEDDVLSVINNLTDFVIEDNEDNKDVASLDFEERKRLTAVLQMQHLMEQYRSGHPQSVILSKESDYIDNDKTDKFFSPQLFATLCKESGKEVSIDSLLEIYDNSESLLLSNDFSSRMTMLLSLMDAAKKYHTYKKIESVIDFDDLLLITYDFARNNPNSIPKYKWIQIDEVQDLNPLQFAIVDAFTDKENVTVYLGDEQQAIFSFIGAKLDTLGWLKERCGSNLHHLDKCYRSPKYLLDVFNDFANYELDTDPDFLPSTNKIVTPKDKDLVLYEAESSETGHVQAVNLALGYPDGKTAIIVTTNAEADNISKTLGDYPHFKISGTDLFSLKQTKLLLAHLNVLNFEINFLAWARILSALKILPTYAKAREFVSTLKSLALNPSDFIVYDDSSYVLEFLKFYKNTPVVIFDTETTGLDVFSNDIVQIAATKYLNGNPVDSLNIILHTDQPIPEKLGKIINPLVEEYKSKPHLNRKQGLKQFIDFAEGCTLIGHNVQYDYNILLNNCKRDLPGYNIPKLFPHVFDTLKLARLLFPSLRSYKLKDLLSKFNLEGENSHLADEDIVATFSVAEYCFNKALSMKDKIIHFLSSNTLISDNLKIKYGPLFLESRNNLYNRVYDDSSALVQELKKAYSFFKNNKVISPFAKFDHICNFLDEEVVDFKAEPSLYEQLGNHIMDLNTFKEADVCNSKIIKENIFIATVHKAKGLEFDNVIVYGCIDNVYPFFASKNDPYARKEDARKLYVAISRAMKRLCLLTFNKRVVYSRRYNQHYTFDAEISPFLIKTIRNHSFKYFKENN